MKIYMGFHIYWLVLLKVAVGIKTEKIGSATLREGLNLNTEIQRNH